MTLAICVFITWFTMIVFSLIPKKLTELEMVIFYFVNTIFEVSLYTISHTNLKWIIVSHSAEHAFSDLVLRFIMIPLVFLVIANILLYTWKVLKWGIVIGVIFCFILFHELLEGLGIISSPHWNYLYTLVLYSIYAVFSGTTAWIMVKVKRKEVKKYGRV